MNKIIKQWWFVLAMQWCSSVKLFECRERRLKWSKRRLFISTWMCFVPKSLMMIAVGFHIPSEQRWNKKRHFLHFELDVIYRWNLNYLLTSNFLVQLSSSLPNLASVTKSAFCQFYPNSATFLFSFNADHSNYSECCTAAPSVSLFV